jgi:hypothetical protein
MRRIFASRSRPKPDSPRPPSRQQEIVTASIAHVTTNPDDANRERWHRTVKESHEILLFLENGSPSIMFGHLEALKRSTMNYLAAWHSPYSQPLSGSDDVLAPLINEAWRRDDAAPDLAILASLYALSMPVAVWHIKTLKDGEIGRYIRCISLVGYVQPHAISKEESQCARILVRMLSSSGQDFAELQQFISTLGVSKSVTFLSPVVIQSALIRSGIGSRLQKQMEAHLDQKRFKTLFLLISWLYDVPKVPENGHIIALLDKHWPAWAMLLAWRPRMERIEKWEQNSFNEGQRKKLGRLFDLDGPDTGTGRRSSLIWAEPHCYEHISVQPKTTQHLERMLDLLTQTQNIGHGAIELYIFLCVDNTADEGAMKMLEKAVHAGNQKQCATLVTVLQALQTAQPSYIQQMRHLTKMLPLLNDQSLREIVDLDTVALVERLTTALKAAQEAFCKQLERGTGENLGMQIIDFGEAIRRSTWIHPYLQLEVLQKVQQFPNRDIAIALFDQLDTHSRSSSHGDVRFKSYLASSVGCRESSDVSVTLEAIKIEVRFWAHPPDVDQKGFAVALAKITSIDYSLYTTCLEAMLREERRFIVGLSNKMKLGKETAFFQIAEFLVQHRSSKKRTSDCWLLLLVSIIKQNGDSFLPAVAARSPFQKWVEIVSTLTSSIAPIRTQLPLSGTGLTQYLVSWWVILGQHMTAIRFLDQMHATKCNLAWLYFLAPNNDILDLLVVMARGQRMSPIQFQIVSCLAIDGKNVIAVRNCLKAVESTSSVVGRAVCERIFFRNNLKWSPSQLAVVVKAWRESDSMAKRRNALALGCIVELLRLPTLIELRTIQIRSVGERLLAEYAELLENAKNLEALRLKSRHQHPDQTSKLLKQLGIDNVTAGRPADANIPEDFLDQVEVVGESEYELSFPLIGFNDLQRRGQGISRHSRMLSIRLHLHSTPRFCLHTSPDERSRSGHSYWRVGSPQKPNTPICTTALTPFTYYLNRNIHELLQGGRHSLGSVFSSISSLVTASPDRCISCCVPLGVKTWATCSDRCSLELGTAPLEIQLHNFLIDKLSIDLLLSCVYMAAADTTDKELLPGCPVEKSKVRAVIDSIPDLDILRKSSNVRKAIHGSDGLGQDRENLLSWLCIKIRGFIVKAPSDFKIPSMGENTKQLLMLNSHPDRERLFKAQQDSQQGTGVVFHGTQPSRMFLILTEGLKAMTNTEFMLHGGVGGAGVYCGDKLEISLPYAGKIGECWNKSELGNMRIMLGCELSGYVSPGSSNTHVIGDGNRLLIRYIFLLPVGFQPAPRHHVAQAMMTAFPRLRSGLI